MFEGSLTNALIDISEVLFPRNRSSCEDLGDIPSLFNISMILRSSLFFVHSVA